MEKREMFRKTVELETGESVTSVYSLTSGPEGFGISVRFPETGEEETAAGISPNKAEVAGLLELMARNTLLPVHLYDVVYDFLCK